MRRFREASLQRFNCARGSTAAAGSLLVGSGGPIWDLFSPPEGANKAYLAPDQALKRTVKRAASRSAAHDLSGRTTLPIAAVQATAIVPAAATNSVRRRLGESHGSIFGPCEVDVMYYGPGPRGASS
jgi:hypothetical protein